MNVLVWCRHVNEESDDEALLTTVQRAFKSIDTDECGFIMEDRLPEVLCATALFDSPLPFADCDGRLVITQCTERSVCRLEKRGRERESVCLMYLII